MSGADALVATVQGAIVAVTTLALLDVRRAPSRQRRDVLWMLLSLAIPTMTTVTAQWIGSAPTWLLRIGSMAALCHPYLLLRLVAHLRPLPAWATRSAQLWTLLALLLAAWPSQALATEGRALLTAGFLVIEAYATAILAAGALASTGVRRWRLGLAAAGSTALLAMLALAAWAMALGSARDATQGPTVLLGLVMIILYFLAFQPPAALLAMWRSVELQRYLEQGARVQAADRAQYMLAQLPQASVDGLGAVAAAALRLEGAQLVAHSLAGWHDEAPKPLADHPALQRCVATRVPCLVDGEIATRSSPGERALLERHGAGALLVAPIVVDETVWGVLAAALPASPLFADSDFEFMRLFCQQAALALQIEQRFAEQDALLARLQRVNADLSMASRHKSAFLANMSHELRTPLNAIIGYAEILEEELDADEGGMHVADLRKIGSAGRHLLGLINNILDISKIESGKAETTLARFHVQTLLDEAIAATGPKIQANGNALLLECDPRLGSAVSDPTMVRQILVNLLANAAKFTENGTVTLRAYREETAGAASLVFVVQDTGIGMSAAEQARVFESFAQASSTTARRYGGTGLGLSLSRAFAELVGGQITLQSQPGVGSVFTLCVPDRGAQLGPSAAGDENPALANEPEPASMRTVSIKLPLVVIIEDDPDAAALIRRHVQSIGCRVMVAPSGEEGLGVVRHYRPVAVLLDVMLPGIDGWSVLQELKSDTQLRAIPVVMVTISDDRKRGFALGAVDFLQKPVQADVLREVLQRYVQPDRVATALIVDDDANLRDLLGRHLRARGLNVVGARDGREGLVMLEQLRPDLVLLDLEMPVLDGFGFLHAKQAAPALADIPVVVLTARCIDEADSARLRDAAVRVLLKAQQPLATVAEEVNVRIRDVIRRSGPRLGAVLSRRVGEA